MKSSFTQIILKLNDYNLSLSAAPEYVHCVHFTDCEISFLLQISRSFKGQISGAFFPCYVEKVLYCDPSNGTFIKPFVYAWMFCTRLPLSRMLVLLLTVRFPSEKSEKTTLN